MSSEQKKPVDYNFYDVLVVGGVEKLICPMSEDTTNVKYFAKLSELYGILAKTHARENAYVLMFLNFCRHCQEKASKKKKDIVLKPMVFNDMNCRGQVDLIDMQTQEANGYKWIMNCQVCLTCLMDN